ncbi:antitoxin MazE [Peptococcaceae bacterium CEB3]|nr:antitoxin MazE [Peptococcaceae bacterium CEB3]
MTTTVTKWGNGLGLHIPQYVAKEIGIKNGTRVEMKIIDGTIIIKPKVCSLRELLDQITPENLHEEFSFGERTGNEEW